MVFGVYETILALGMLITGSANTIFTKWQDKTFAVGRYDNNHIYNHPFFQSMTMFLGESLCLLAYFGTKVHHAHKNRGLVSVKDEKKYPWYLFALPTLCDLTSTTIMNFGLQMTPASVYQMMRGAMVLFTAIFSVVFLKHRLNFSQYLGLFLVICGIAVVGLVSMLYSKKDEETHGSPTVGAILVFSAQIVVATQFVVEDKLLGKYDVPALLAVGSEGIWGVFFLSIILPCLQFIQHNGAPLEDTYDGLLQLKNSSEVIVATLGSIFSIAFFNFFGISVTKCLSATHRTTIDSTRTFVIWMICLALHWEEFYYLELIGFFMLVVGTFYYNEIIPVPFEAKLRKTLCDCCFPISGEYEQIVDDDSDDEKDSEYGSPGQHIRSPMDHRLRLYTSLQLPAARELPEFVTQSLSSFRFSMLRA